MSVASLIASDLNINQEPSCGLLSYSHTLTQHTQVNYTTPRVSTDQANVIKCWAAPQLLSKRISDLWHTERKPATCARSLEREHHWV